MSGICLIDTSIFLNILKVPSKCDEYDKVMETFEAYIHLDVSFILPMATVIETGNHIGQNGNGNLRRDTALRFIQSVKDSFNGESPWKLSPFPSTEEILEWIDLFPDEAGRNKTANKPNEGTSFGDLSIIKEFERLRNRHSMSEIFIWSLDSDLEACSYKP